MALRGLKRAFNAVKYPIVATGRAYNEVAQRYPFGTGVVTTVVKTSAADLFAQKVIEKREEMDFKRHGVFITFGLFYLAGFQYYLYNHLFVRWCAGMTAALGHKGSAPIKTFIDQAIHHPFFYFPVFYSMKGYVEGRSPAEIFERYRNELWENCKALWTIWVPAQMVNFSVVPRHLRIPFVAGVSFAWTVVISVMRGALDSGKVAAAAPTTAQLDDAVATVAAAVGATAAAGRAEQPAAAAPQVLRAMAEPAAAGVAHAPVIAAGEVRRSQAAVGLKALVVPRGTAHAEAAA
ncbi:hypothetical protein COO60DRAFT_1504019 [Scenedesmus sp. NREL 46B-D3]|nr:hypothetical protein COO60DRAFT_1504019 [Scenedesmus sp. NREL 46B-D3]